MLRIAFIGKGGVGKSLIAGTVARLLAAEGEPVLAVDSDPLPGLALSIGVDADDAGLPDEVTEEAPEGQGWPWQLRSDMDVADVIERYALRGPDGVRFLQFGKPQGSARKLMRSQIALRQVMAGLPTNGWHVIGDLPAGTRQAFFGWADYARRALVVCEPSSQSLATARRLARLGTAEGGPQVAAVASKVRSDDDVAYVSERSRLPVLGAVPADEAVRTAESTGTPLIDVDGDSDAVRAIRSLLEKLRAEEGT